MKHCRIEAKQYYTVKLCQSLFHLKRSFARTGKRHTYTFQYLIYFRSPHTINSTYRPFSSLGYFRKSCESTWRTCINLYCVTLTYVRLRSGHVTHEKGLYLGYFSAGYVRASTAKHPLLGMHISHARRG